MIEPCVEVARPDPEEILREHTRILLSLRHEAQRDRPGAVLPVLVDGARVLAAQAATVGGAPGRVLWMAAARYAEFTGWMVQEAGDEAGANRWTAAAARFAARGGDRDMRSYLWERRALGALYRADGRETVRLAQRGAAVLSASDRVRGLALRREAQGHALRGDIDAFRRARDAAVELIASGPAPYPAGDSWGPNTVDDAGVLVEASCLVDLGRHCEAAELFGPDPASMVPPAALRTRARFAAQAATAYAGAGEIGLACALTERLLPEAVRVDSATIRTDLRRLLGLISRDRRNSRAKALIPDLYNAVRCRPSCGGYTWQGSS